MLATQEMLVELMKEKYKEPYVKGLAPRELSSKSTHWIQGPIIYAPKSQTHTLVVITKSHIPLNPSLSAPGIIREFHIKLQKIYRENCCEANILILFVLSCYEVTYQSGLYPKPPELFHLTCFLFLTAPSS